MKITRMLDLYDKGILSPKECAYQYLADLAVDPQMPINPLALPVRIREQFLVLLRKIRADSYQWKIFLIGGAPRPTDPERIKRICAESGL